jgi:hypothetical protein
LRESVRIASQRSVLRSPATACALLALAALAALAGNPARSDPKPAAEAEVEAVTVTARPIAAFDRSDAAKTRFGKLTWRGGVVLTSPSRNFGGWSGLTVDDKGKTLLAISDAGSWMTAELVSRDGRPAGLSGVRLGPILSLSGANLTRKRDHDAEGLALAKGTPEKGSVLISFERNHRIGRFEVGPDGLSPARSYVPLPPETKRMKSNQGIEAVAVLRGGPF